VKDLRENIETIQKEFNVIKQTPISFAFGCVVITGALWLVFHFTFGSRLDSKDATIQSVEHERDRFKTEAERLEKENERLRRGLPATPATSLKKQADVLAGQLLEFASTVRTNQQPFWPGQIYDFRFDKRMRLLRDELDRMGIHSEGLDRAANLGSWMMGEPNMRLIAEMVEAVVKDLRESTKDLKE
jgi:hypothetical protein